jgi:hypothetical protein
MERQPQASPTINSCIIPSNLFDPYTLLLRHDDVVAIMIVQIMRILAPSTQRSQSTGYAPLPQHRFHIDATRPSVYSPSRQRENFPTASLKLSMGRSFLMAAPFFASLAARGAFLCFTHFPSSFPGFEPKPVCDWRGPRSAPILPSQGDQRHRCEGHVSARGFQGPSSVKKGEAWRAGAGLAPSRRSRQVRARRIPDQGRPCRHPPPSSDGSFPP